MNDVLKTGYEVVNDMLGPEAVAGMKAAAVSEEFGGEIGELAVQYAFGTLWSREGLGRKERSLVTLGILIALRATEELHYHFPIALKNGVTRKELEEVIYHASGYAGFPAAASARQIAKQILDKAG
ncbi:MAG: carboxymuconolactone decarboxylase [Sphingobium sp.]|uniref:carboxymuconolactone decarboxylase family protein n=1 Tax=Sphingobium sp. TaxID=1912891 RepID=UPI000DB7F108|nr:carboxymuconolactone decarboxylase family protein [Sphingobium sp.]PZU08303.1 MAG: carboxymuconolactone decarboxylase [Sphingobium sp.]